MRSRLPPLHTLYAFESAARHSSFSRAAEELLLTRSAVSHRICLLESLTDTVLFYRRGRTLELSPAGQKYIVAVRQALTALESLMVPDRRNMSEASITISSPPSFAHLILWPDLQEFKSQNPEIQISIELSSSALDVPTTGADVYIRFGKGHYSGMQSLPLEKSDIMPAVSAEYAKSMNLSRVEDLARCTLLRSPLEPWMPWLKAAGMPCPEPVTGPHFGDISMMYQAAHEGLGVALFRLSLLERFDSDKKLVCLGVIRAVPEYGYHIVFREEVKNSPSIARLIAWLQRKVRA